MARGTPPVKSQAIKDYLATNKKASPKQIVEALKEKGIDVSLGLASVVKYSKGKKKARGKKAGRPTGVANGQPGRSGSEYIREYIAKNPSAGPKDIQSGLEVEGVTVKLGLISAVKYSKRPTGKRLSRTRVLRVVAQATSSSAPTFDQLVQVKQLTDSLGGADQVRAALEALTQLQ